MAPTVCMPTRFAPMCSKLTEDQKRVIAGLGFDGLLRIPAMPIQRILLEKITENYNVVDKSFTIRNHVVPICTWDVYWILGLDDKSERIQISKSRVDSELFQRFKGKGETSITFNHLEKEILTGAADEHFVRVFVLYMIGTVLAPCSKEYVSSFYLPLVKDISKIKGYNWAQFTLDYLTNHLALFKTNKRTGLVGNLAFLQVWLFERFQVDGDCLDYEYHEHPLIKNWDERKVVKRALAEGINKSGGTKVLIRLELKKPKVGGEHVHLDEDSDKGYDKERNSQFFEDMELSDVKVEKEEVKVDASEDVDKRDGCDRKETSESIKDVISELRKANYNYKTMDGRVEVVEERTRCLPELLNLVQL